ncbi:MAG: ogr/Delta-like zinc finger family protein [Gammaproteobacteria bacterium]|nr:ogr/Delta-like zinc finger family protein [Gammaproteobacteria bacterium]
MNTKQQCPNCGSPADEVGSAAKSVDLTEFSFRCTNNACRSNFAGVLTLTRGGLPGAENFNGRSRPADKAGAAVTDC